jgi:putative tryptophan/tyrosine transport system substrate-binding protein
MSAIWSLLREKRPFGYENCTNVGWGATRTNFTLLLAGVVRWYRDVEVLPWPATNADDLGMTLRYKSADAAARTLGFEIQPLGVREPEDFAAAFSAMERDRPDAILMVTDALTSLNRKRVFEFAAQHKLPAIYEYSFLVRDGGLMSYGPDMDEVYDRAADLAVRILNGARPADLPFEQPTRFRLAINKKTLEALGLTIPAAVLMRADEVVD